MSRARLRLLGSTFVLIATCSLGPAAGASTHSAAPPRADIAPAVSDQGQIAYLKWQRFIDRPENVVVENADGTNRRVVLSYGENDIHQVSLSPDGLWMAISTFEGVAVRLIDGTGDAQPITVPGRLLQESSKVTWSPDSKQIAFTIDSEETGERDVVVANLATRTGNVVSADQTGAFHIAWSPDGHWLATERQSTKYGCDTGEGIYYYYEVVEMRPGGGDVTPLTDDRPWDWSIIDWGTRGILGRTDRTGSTGDTSQLCQESVQRMDVLRPRQDHDTVLLGRPDADPIAWAPDGSGYLGSRFGEPDVMWRSDLRDDGSPIRVTKYALNGDWSNLPS